MVLTRELQEKFPSVLRTRLFMGSLLGLVQRKGVPEALEHALPFLDEIDGNALAEAVMAPKPILNPKPHTFWHGGDLYLSSNGTHTVLDPWDEDYVTDL